MAKVRKDLEGSVIAVNESEQYTHLVAGDTIPDGYFIGGHAVEGGDPTDQTPPWQSSVSPQPAAPAATPGEGALEQLLASGASPQDIVAAIAERLGVPAPADQSEEVDDESDEAKAAEKAAKKASKGEPPASVPTPPAAAAPAGAAGDELVPPPLNGAGSAAPAWRDYAIKAVTAAGLEIDIPEDAKRSDIVDALKSAGIRTE